MFTYTARFAFATVALAASLLVGIRLIAQANDPLIGMWVLDRSKSTFIGNAPGRRTMTFEKVAAGIKHTTETGAGTPQDAPRGGADSYRVQYTFQVDGKDYVADPQMAVNTVAFKRVDANTVERTGKYQGTAVETVTYQVSPDGKILTVTQKGTFNGIEVSSVQVFTRQ